MNLTLTNFQTVISKPQLTKASRLAVRECDEVSKGEFVAYVDEGDESYDVKLKFNTKAELKEHACDCGKRSPFCLHKTALLLHLTKGTAKTKTGVKRARKMSKTEALLKDIEHDALIAWLANLLGKNKEVELSFLHHFTVTEKEYDPPEVERVTNEAIKAVVKSKWDIDRTSIKQLIALWTTIHEPIVKAYLANVTNKTSFLNFHTILECCIRFNLERGHSKLIEKYVSGLLKQSSDFVHELENEDAWFTATNHFVKLLTQDLDHVRMHYLLYLQDLIERASPGRSSRLVKTLVEEYKSNRKQLYSAENYTISIFNLAKQYNLPADYQDIFRPLTWRNKYNEDLIRLLIRDKHIRLAEKHCLQQIRANVQHDYNLPYLSLLKELYIEEENEEGLARIIPQLFPLSFDFTDYQYLASYMSDAQKKTWRATALSKARNIQHRSPAAEEFCFLLSDSEGTYKKMIDYIQAPVPYHLVARYMEPMLMAGKDELLRKLLYTSSARWGNDPEGDAEAAVPYLTSIYDQLLKHFTPDALKKIVRQSNKDDFGSGGNWLVRFMRKELGV